MIEYDDSGDIVRVTHDHDHDPVPIVGGNAIRYQLTGRIDTVWEALGELDITQLRRLNQACHQVGSAAAQMIVELATQKRGQR